VASGGWLGLSRGQGWRGARRNRGIARRNRALPARDCARKGWARWGARWNWLSARAGASSEFYEGSPSRREPVRWPPEGGSASLEAMGGGVHDGIGTLPDELARD